LEAGILEADQVRTPVRGTPQGGVLSPLLANIALHPLDRYWEAQHPETKLIRYADDFVVLTRGRPAAAYRLNLENMTGRLKLRLSPEKTRIVEAEAGFDFLGVHFVRKPTRRTGTGAFCYAFPTAKAMNHVRQKIREAIGRDVRQPLTQVIEALTPLLRGWSGYFNWLNSGQHFRKVDQYVVWKLRRWLRRKQQRTRRAFRRPSRVRRMATWRADLVKEPGGAGSAFTLPARREDGTRSGRILVDGGPQDRFRRRSAASRACSLRSSPPGDP